MKIKLECIQCGQIYNPEIIRYRCNCGGTLDVIHDFESLKKLDLKEIFEERYCSRELPLSSGVWRYKELVLPLEDEEIITRNEGNTNIYKSDRISTFTGLENISLKHEGENPTGSFKDRGMTSGITTARKLGCNKVICASTGNTSASLASYAAWCGMEATVLIPKGEVALGKLAQTLAFGAKCLQLKGDFDSAMKMVSQLSGLKGIYLLNSVNPFRIEGQKTIIFEALQQNHWQVPDWIVLPGGNLGNSSALGKGLMELHFLGLISRIPRIAVIQAMGANPFYQDFTSGFTNFRPMKADTLATAIRIGDPVSFSKCRRAIAWSKGLVEHLTEEEILAAKAVVDSSGVGAEPASCCTVGGVKKLVERGMIKKGDHVLGILTGHMLKDPGTIIDFHSGLYSGSDNATVNRLLEFDSDSPELEDII